MVQVVISENGTSESVIRESVKIESVRVDRLPQCSFKELFISMDGYKTIVYKKRKGFDFDDIDQSLCIYSTSKQAYELGM